MTLPTQPVLRALMEDPTRERYGLELCASAGLERVGWLISRWETVDPAEQGRPRRRYYRLDPDSVAVVQAALRRAEASTRALTRLRPGLAGKTS